MNQRLETPSPFLSVALAAALGLAVGAATLVWARTRIVSLRYESVELIQEESQLREELERLRLERAALAAPERIERFARRLGLEHPAPGQVLRVELNARGEQRTSP